MTTYICTLYYPPRLLPHCCLRSQNPDYHSGGHQWCVLFLLYLLFSTSDPCLYPWITKSPTMSPLTLCWTRRTITGVRPEPSCWSGFFEFFAILHPIFPIFLEIGHHTFPFFSTFFEVRQSFPRLQGVVIPHITVPRCYSHPIWDRTMKSKWSPISKTEKKEKENETDSSKRDHKRTKSEELWSNSCGVKWNLNLYLGYSPSACCASDSMCTFLLLKLYDVIPRVKPLLWLSLVHSDMTRMLLSLPPHKN